MVRQKKKKKEKKRKRKKSNAIYPQHFHNKF